MYYDDYDDGLSSNGLVRSYQTNNLVEGHSQNCAWGAGGDCTCGAIDYTCDTCKGTGERDGKRCDDCDGAGDYL